jgi:hypothetical protein
MLDRQPKGTVLKPFLVLRFALRSQTAASPKHEHFVPHNRSIARFFPRRRRVGARALLGCYDALNHFRRRTTVARPRVTHADYGEFTTNTVAVAMLGKRGTVGWS